MDGNGIGMFDHFHLLRLIFHRAPVRKSNHCDHRSLRVGIKSLYRPQIAVAGHQGILILHDLIPFPECLAPGRHFLLPRIRRVHQILNGLVQCLGTIDSFILIRRQDLHAIQPVSPNLFLVKMPDCLCGLLCSRTGNKIEVLPKLEIRPVLLHLFCIEINAAGRSLPEDCLQPGHRDQSAGNQLAENITGSH